MRPIWRTTGARMFARSCGMTTLVVLTAAFAGTLPAMQNSGSSQSTQPPQSSSDQQGQTQTPPASSKEKKEKKENEAPQTRLRIEVTAAETGKPIANASVYIRFESGHTFLLHKEKQAELNFKTNQEGVVKIPDVPQKRVLIQVVAPGWHTYGKWYDFDKDDETVQIKLEKPPKWY